ncbi:hypothetical protein HYV12_03145 [Candidatus Dojkabacteria bacterium]|nr:hypothetical protein [Candidatus Dojkabacteria bacterium]
MYSNLEKDLVGLKMSAEVLDFYGLCNRYAEERHITPWGLILKNVVPDIYLAEFISILEAEYGLEDLSHSVAFGVMEADAFHRPYIRNVNGVSNAKRIYKVMAGSLRCVRDGEMKEYTPESELMVVGNQDICSFKAGEEGCVFAIIDFPAFDLGYDLNEIF